MSNACPKNKIINPVSGRYVLKNGKIGQQICRSRGRFKFSRSRPSRSRNAPIRRRPSRRRHIPTRRRPSRSRNAPIRRRPSRRRRPIQSHRDEIITKLSKITKTNKTAYSNWSTHELEQRLEAIAEEVWIDDTEIALIELEKVEKTTWHGSMSDRYKSIRYLYSKHKNMCIIADGLYYSLKFNNLYEYDPHSLFNLYYKDPELWSKDIRKDKKKITKSFKKNILKCKKNKKRFIIIPLKIKTYRGYHANVFIYDTVNKTIERFEPHGSSSSYNADTLDKKSKRFFDRLDIQEYYTTPYFCPNIGFQNIQSTEKQKKTGEPGFCLAWVMWYIDMRLSYPNLTQTAVVDKALEKLKDHPYSFTEFIRNYSKFLLKF